MTHLAQFRPAIAFVLVAAGLLAFAPVPAEADEAQLLAALSALEGHVDGTSPLTGSQIGAHQTTVFNNASIFGDTAATITASFDLVTAYEASPSYGPMWGAGSAQDTFDRNADKSQDINWTVFQVMQNIVDDTYNSTNLAAHSGLINGYAFQSGSVFPGPVNAPVNPSVHTVAIDASFVDSFGRNTQHWDWPARKATGTTLAPGSVATVTVPASIVGKGYQVRVGAHAWDMSSNNRRWIDRLDRSTVAYNIDNTTIEVASPLGGNLYIEVPLGANEGVVNIDIQNVARSPFFSLQDHFQTTLTDWQTTERNYASPWTDFQTEKVMLQVPTGWVYQLDDPKTLLENWDKAADVTNALMGFPVIRGKETIYNQVDVRNRSSVLAPGYPAINNTYDPLRNQDASGWNTSGNAYTGNSSSYLVTGPQNAPDFEFHELGHSYFFPKFGGETESAVNLLHVAVMQQAFGKSWDEAFAGSRGFAGNPHRTIDNTAVTWMTSFNFAPREVPMHTAEKAYQLKGHAKYVEYARLFGWDKLGDYWLAYNTDDENGTNTNPFSGDDGHLFRLSEAAGVDIVPLFHFWGIHPQNYSALKAEFDSRGIGPSTEVYNLLQHYKSLVPADNAAFQTFALNWWGHQPSENGNWTESEHARYFDQSILWPGENDVQQWVGLTINEEYNDAVSAAIQDVVFNLITQYYGGVYFLPGDFNEDFVINEADWVIFLNNNHSDLGTTDPDVSFLLGDLDRDLDSDIYDFDLFRLAYEEFNGVGSFAAMLAGSAVPEPSSIILLASGAVGLGLRRRRNASQELL